MHKEDIKAALRKRNTSLAQIARELGISRAAVTYAITRGPSKRVEQVIAEKLNLPHQRVFPGRK